MTARFEAADARDVSVRVARPGEQLGVELLSEHALVFSYDEVFYITGTPEQLAAMLVDAASLVRKVSLVGRHAAELTAMDEEVDRILTLTPLAQVVPATDLHARLRRMHSEIAGMDDGPEKDQTGERCEALARRVLGEVFQVDLSLMSSLSAWS